MRTTIYLTGVSGRGWTATGRDGVRQAGKGARRRWGSAAGGVVGGLIATGVLSMDQGRWVWAALVVALLVGAVAVARGDVLAR
jgi:hypothetical protein